MKSYKDIYLVPTFHHDIAYLQPESWYTQKANTILDSVLELLEQDKDYTFMVEQAYFLAEYIKKHPEKMETLRKFAAEGRLVFEPGFWSVPDMCMPSGESLFQNATYGRRFIRETLGLSPRVVMIADCWGHHGQLPQILKSCGYDYYVFSRCMECDFEKENFRWVGLDGTEIKTHWLSKGYAGVLFPSTIPATNAEELSWESASRDGILNMYRDTQEYCGDEVRIIPAGGDMMTPSGAAPEMVKKWQQDPQMPRVSFSTFAEALDQVAFDEKEVYANEFVSALKGSFSTNIRIKIANRTLEQQLYALEVLASLKGKQIDFSKEWELALKNQFHDILCGTICDDALVQAYDEYEATFAQMEEYRKALSDGTEKAAFNPLPFSVTELRGNTQYQADGFSYAKQQKYDVTQSDMPQNFENEWYFAEISANGFITKLVEKQTQTVVFEEKDIPFGSLLMEADGGDNWMEFEYPWELNAQRTMNVPDPYDRSVLQVHPKTKLRSVGVTGATAELLSDGSYRITQEGILDYWATRIPFSVTMTLSKQSPRIDYHTEFECTNNRIRLRVAFPTDLQGASIRHQIPYGMIERGEGTQPLEYVMDQQSNAAGLALINRGLPANNTENGIMMLTLFRSVAMEYKCKSALSYNLGERIACDYAILPHATEQDVMLWEQSLAFQCPLVDTTKEALLPIRIEGGMISAMREDKGALFMRLYHGLSCAQNMIIHVPEEFASYALTDGCMEEVTEPVEIMNQRIEITLGAYKIQGMKLFRKEENPC